MKNQICVSKNVIIIFLVVLVSLLIVFSSNLVVNKKLSTSSLASITKKQNKLVYNNLTFSGTIVSFIDDPVNRLGVEIWKYNNGKLEPVGSNVFYVNNPKKGIVYNFELPYKSNPFSSLKVNKFDNYLVKATAENRNGFFAYSYVRNCSGKYIQHDPNISPYDSCVSTLPGKADFTLINNKNVLVVPTILPEGAVITGVFSTSFIQHVDSLSVGIEMQEDNGNWIIPNVDNAGSDLITQIYFHNIQNGKETLFRLPSVLNRYLSKTKKYRINASPISKGSFIKSYTYFTQCPGSVENNKCILNVPAEVKLIVSDEVLKDCSNQVPCQFNAYECKYSGGKTTDNNGKCVLKSNFKSN